MKFVVLGLYALAALLVVLGVALVSAPAAFITAGVAVAALTYLAFA